MRKTLSIVSTGTHQSSGANGNQTLSTRFTIPVEDDDMGKTWKEASPDLTRNEKEKQGKLEGHTPTKK
jgi:hypothetical protein